MPPQITCPHCGNTINLENRKEVDFEKIMHALGKSPKTFTELLTMTNLPRKTLNLRLKELCASGAIMKDGGYHLNSSIKPTNRILGKKNGNGKMNQTILHIKKNVQWIPVALIICLVVVAVGSAIMISPPAPSPPPAPLAPAQPVQMPSMPAARIYVDPLPTTINQSQIGQTITLNIMVSNVTDLYTWQAGMTFNPAVFNCALAPAPGNSATNGTTALREGPFLQTGGYTLWVNTAMTEDGVIPYVGCTLTGPTTPGVSGGGVLATVEFVVIGAGATNIHLTNVMLLDPTQTVIPVFVAT